MKKKIKYQMKKAGDFQHQFSDASDPEQITYIFTTLNMKEWLKGGI